MEQPQSRKERDRLAKQRADVERVKKIEARLRENVGKAADSTHVLVWDKTTGDLSEVPSIHASHVQRLGFAACVPGDWRIAGGASVAEMQARALHELLIADYHIFWSHVLHDSELRRFLDTFLRFCPRSFDESFVPLSSGAAANSSSALIFQRVLRVLARASVARESKDFFVEQSFFETWVKSPACWFDAPLLLDMCVLYLDANRKLVQGIVQSVASINGNKLVLEWRQVSSVMVKTCDKAFASGSAVAADAARGDAELFLLDSLCNMLALLSVYPKASKHLQAGGNLIAFCSRCFGLWTPRFSNAKRRERIKRLCVSVAFILLQQCFLTRVYEAGSNKYQPTIGAEFLTLLKDVDCAGSEFMAVMQSTHDVVAALKKLLQSGTGLDRRAVEEACVQLLRNDKAPKQHAAVSKGNALSKQVAQVLEVLPELGQPFVEACLQSMNHDAEKVINALLTHELPPEIAELDRKTGKPMVIVVAGTGVGPVAVPGKGKEEMEFQDVPPVKNVVEMTKCLMEEIAEERAPVVSSLHQGKRVVEDEGLDADLRARVTSYAMYEDEMDDSFLVHADVAMEKMGIDEAEELKLPARQEEEGEVSKVSTPVAAVASSSNAKHPADKNKAGRGRRKQGNMKKTGILNLSSK